MARKPAHIPPQSAQLSVEQMKAALARLDKRLEEAQAFSPEEIRERSDPKIRTLENAIDDFLTKTFGKDSAEYKRYASAKSIDTAGYNFSRGIPHSEVIAGLLLGKARAIGILESIKKTFLEEIELTGGANMLAAQPAATVQSVATAREIFVVHGTDLGTKEAVARCLQKLELTPVVLHEQANKGRTIHQKFRDHSAVRYAVVLFTDDDIGGPKDSAQPQKPRPRQNVVYELGFFSAKLGDSHVCVLYSEGVEMPSDLSGVLYIPLDTAGSWRFQLAKELKGVGVDVDMNKLI
jgi:predicted nucleotide-binding protein